MDNASEARLQNVHPELADKIRTMATMLHTEGIEIRVTQGLRSWSDQMALWLKGRDSHGNITDPSKVVTKAAPGYSWHQFKLAVDVVPIDAEGQPDWDLQHPAWKRIIQVGESLGLTSGSEFRTFPDWPHLQMTGSLPLSPTDAVRAAFMAGSYDAVWQMAGLLQPADVDGELSV